MSKRQDFNALYIQLSKFGFSIETWAPGDGKTRYTLIKDGRKLARALGIGEAIIMLSAFLAGWDERGRKS